MTVDNPESLHTMARQAQVVDWVAAGCLTLLLYDHFVTFGQEVTRIWTMKARIPKSLFFMIRYFIVPIIVFNSIASNQTNPSAPFCVFYLRWLDVGLALQNFAVEGILTLRIWAIYKDNKFATFFALALYISEVAIVVGLTIKDYVGESVLIVTDFSELPGCYAAAVPNIIAGYWITPLIVESIFFIMTAWKTIKWSIGRTHAPPRPLVVLARDSTVYFFFIFAILLANLLVFEFGPPFLAGLLVTPVNTFGCIAGTRMLLNLRGAMYDVEDSIPLVHLNGSHSGGLSNFRAKHGSEVPRTASGGLVSLSTTTDTFSVDYAQQQIQQTQQQRIARDGLVRGGTADVAVE